MEEIILCIGFPQENGGARAEEKTPEAEPVLPGDGSPKMQLDLDVQSDKTGVSQKTEQSDDSKRKKKAKTPEEPFVVGEWRKSCCVAHTKIGCLICPKRQAFSPRL